MLSTGDNAANPHSIPGTPYRFAETCYSNRKGRASEGVTEWAV
jgi:negative regulator of replication initiation